MESPWGRHGVAMGSPWSRYGVAMGRRLPAFFGEGGQHEGFDGVGMSGGAKKNRMGGSDLGVTGGKHIK